MNNTLIILDVETTGLDPQKEKILEFAGIKLQNGEIIDEFETLINPEQHIRHSSIAIHGITEDMVQDAPTTAEIMPKIFEFIGNHPIVAHNAIFDYSFLNETHISLYQTPFENSYIDSQQMFKDICPDEKSHGLNTLMERFHIEPQGTKHRAMADAKGLALAYPHLEKLYFQRNEWQISQFGNLDYLFERYIRIQNTIQVLQSELSDIKAIFKVYFEQGGTPIISYPSKTCFSYDFQKVKPVLEELNSIEKVIKLNNGLIDRIATSRSITEEQRQIINDAKIAIKESRSIHVSKPEP